MSSSVAQSQATGHLRKRAKILQGQLAAETTKDDDCDELLRKILARYSQGLEPNLRDLANFAQNCVTDENRIRWLNMILEALNSQETKVVEYLDNVLKAIVPNIYLTRGTTLNQLYIAIRNARQQGKVNSEIYDWLKVKLAPLQRIAQDSQMGTPDSSSATGGGGTPSTRSTVFDASSPQQQQQKKQQQQQA